MCPPLCALEEEEEDSGASTVPETARDREPNSDLALEGALLGNEQHPESISLGIKLGVTSKQAEHHDLN